MATGRMTDKLTKKTVGHFMPVAAGCLLALAASLVGATDVGLAGVTSTRAMLIINNGEPQAVAVGQTVDGVKVLSVQGDQVSVEIDGKKRSLRVGQHAIGATSADGGGKVVLTANGQGHFLTTGTINGKSVKFLVDTGATSIAMGPSDAQRLGIDINNGKPTNTGTANGVARATLVKLNTVRIGDITLNNVDGLVVEAEMPYALLGMSFLNRMEMQRDGSTMTLKKRF